MATTNDILSLALKNKIFTRKELAIMQLMCGSEKEYPTVSNPSQLLRSFVNALSPKL